MSLAHNVHPALEFGPGNDLDYISREEGRQPVSLGQRRLYIPTSGLALELRDAARIAEEGEIGQGAAVWGPASGGVKPGRRPVHTVLVGPT